MMDESDINTHKMIVMKLFEVLHDQTRLIDQMGFYFINIVDEPMDIGHK